jgi:hypothetical protein
MMIVTQYYRGFLALDRFAGTPEAVALDEEATALWKASERGELILYQRRLGPDRFEYWAARL